MDKKRKKNIKSSKVVENSRIENGIESFTEKVVNGSQLSKTQTLMNNNRYNYIFNDRNLLSSLYIEHGLIQTLIDIPVDDGFSKGIEIKSKQLDDDDISLLQQTLQSNDIYKKVAETIKWGRLFGGAGLVIIASQDPKKEFDISKVNKYSKLDFYAADLWELNRIGYTGNSPLNSADVESEYDDATYSFYGTSLHESRVLAFKGKQAPSFRRPNFRGWGMSEVERFIRSFNQYLKNQDVIFELLDEAKIDIYKLQNYNTSMISGQEDDIQKQIEMSNLAKNYLNALVMDKEDDYQQKQVTFAGLGEVLTQIRQGIASDLKIPISKLFGVSSTGFSSGEDDIENYNKMVETEVRSKSNKILRQVINIFCQKLFGFVPEDLELEWSSLRILSSEQEEIVKTQKADRLLNFFSAGLVDTREAKEIINRDNLVSVDLEVNDDLNEDVSILDSQSSSLVTSDRRPRNKRLAKNPPRSE